MHKRKCPKDMRNFASRHQLTQPSATDGAKAFSPLKATLGAQQLMLPKRHHEDEELAFRLEVFLPRMDWVPASYVPGASKKAASINLTAVRASASSSCLEPHCWSTVMAG